MIASYGSSLLGGVLIGLSAALFLLFHGRIAGVSGIFGGLLLPGHAARRVRAAFILGLVLSGLLLTAVYPRAFSAARMPTLPVAALAGLLVGIGTRLGGGCTSGHGVCGLGRLSSRSAVATATFMGVAIVTVFVVSRVLGGAGLR